MSTNEPQINSNPENKQSRQQLLDEIIKEIESFSEHLTDINAYFDSEIELKKAAQNFKITNNKEEYEKSKEKIREKHTIQKIGLAKTKELIEKLINKGLVSKEFFNIVVSKMREIFHFTNKDMYQFEIFIDYYIEYHKNVRLYFERECQGDPKILFERIFLKNPNNFPELKFKIGPFGYEFELSSESIKTLHESDNVVGFAGILHDRNFLNGYDLFYNVSQNNDEDTLIHERRHNIFSFFRSNLLLKLSNVSELQLVRQIVENEGNEEKQKIIYTNYFKHIRERYMVKVADEILAILSEPNSNISFSKYFLNFSEEGAYDYMKAWRNKSGTIRTNSNPYIPYFSKERFTELIDEIRDLKTNKIKHNPIYEFLSEDAYPQVMEAVDEYTMIGDLKTRPKPFIPNADIVNEARFKVFEEEYIQIILEIEKHIIDFLKYFPDKREFLLQNLSLVNIRYWNATIKNLFEILYFRNL